MISKGKWEVRKLGITYQIFVETDTKQGYYQVAEGIFNGTNAHLIAAAPDLYEVLKDMVDENDCSFDHHGYCQEHGWSDESECPNSRAKKVIAKVEGK